ncbi:MAG: cold-shock protein [Tsuneonella suprasediminis]|nr:cold-shock protein [Altererythrobacter sp. N1]
MTHFGTIKSYDTSKGSGMISPEKGGEPLAFAKADLQQEAAEPKSGQRYGYATSQVAGGKARATNLQPENAKQAQAENQQG